MADQFLFYILDMFLSPAGALKSYLRELPEPLMTTELYDEWIQASKWVVILSLKIILGLSCWRWWIKSRLWNKPTNCLHGNWWHLLESATWIKLFMKYLSAAFKIWTRGYKHWWQYVKNYPQTTWIISGQYFLLSLHSFNYIVTQVWCYFLYWACRIPPIIQMSIILTM